MNIYHFFDESCAKYPDHEALNVENKSYSYTELDRIIGKVSGTLITCPGPHVGIFASRSLSAYAGLLAALKAGKAYVPLNSKFPVSRNGHITSLADLHTLIVDRKSLPYLQNLVKYVDRRFTLLFPEMHSEEIPVELRLGHKVYGSDLLQDYYEHVADPDESRIAYILFTSGSTGVPKGVPVSHGNVAAYVSYQKGRYDFSPEDRFSQTFDLTFDPSVHDIFICFQAGASLYSVPESELMAPARFLDNHRLTVWYSVPSIAQFMHRFGMLKPNRFPHLRYSIFSGEALPKNIALDWKRAAPNAALENLYGPTEATINITHYRLPDNPEDVEEVNGIVSIGTTFETQDHCLIDDNGRVVEHEGELCVSGSLVTEGYLDNPEKTAEQYIKISGKEGIWYKTGDLVREEAGKLFYITRKDFQVKIRGFRVELDEVNLAISNATGASVVCSLPYPVNNGVAESIYSFVDRQHRMEKSEIYKRLVVDLPDYMIPKEIIFIDQVPLNSNGKIDRKSLIENIQSLTYETIRD